MEESTESTPQPTPPPPPLFHETLKDAVIHMSGNISDFTNLKKQTFALEIGSRWGKDIIEEGARKIAWIRGETRVVIYHLILTLIICNSKSSPNQDICPFVQRQLPHHLLFIIWETSSLRENRLEGSMGSIIVDGDRLWSHGSHHHWTGEECGDMGSIITEGGIVLKHGSNNNWGGTDYVGIGQSGYYQLLTEGGAFAQQSLDLWENNEKQLLTK